MEAVVRRQLGETAGGSGVAGARVVTAVGIESLDARGPFCQLFLALHRKAFGALLLALASLLFAETDV